MIVGHLAAFVLCLFGPAHSLHWYGFRQEGMFEISVPQGDDDLYNFLDNGPPPFTKYARMARYIVHNSEWTAMATINSNGALKGYPRANVFSMSDGSTAGKSTGIPYFYITEMGTSSHDLEADSRASLTMTLAQGSYCKEQSLDAEDPRCSHIILTGKIVKLQEGSDEEDFAKDALFTRHPVMATWPDSHGWYFAKLEIESILLLDFFGYIKKISLAEYIAADPY